MKLGLGLLTAALFVSACPLATAESLHNVEAMDSLGDIKQKYPNAKFSRVRAAWVTEAQDFYSMEGAGFPGKLYIAFDDSRPRQRKRLAELPPLADGQAADTTRQFLQKSVTQTDDDALTVDWVRWVPTQPIPLARYKSKYGEPTKCDFQVDTMRPFCDWPTKGLLVNLSDDQKDVLSAEGTFTRAEYRAAWQSRYGFVPDWWKDETPSNSSSATTSAPKSDKASVPAKRQTAAPQ